MSGRYTPPKPRPPLIAAAPPGPAFDPNRVRRKMSNRVRVTIQGVIVDDDWSPDSYTFSEGEAIEGRYGGSIGEWSEALGAGVSKARRVLAWSLLARDTPNLSINAVDFPLKELIIDSICNTCDTVLVVKTYDTTTKDDNGVMTAATAATAKADRLNILEHPDGAECAGEPQEVRPTTAEGDESSTAPSANGDSTTSLISPTSSTSDLPTGIPAEPVAV